MTTRKALLAGLAVLALAPVLAMAHPAVGDSAIDVAVYDTAGVVHHLSEYRGQVIQLFFWQST